MDSSILFAVAAADVHEAWDYGVPLFYVVYALHEDMKAGGLLHVYGCPTDAGGLCCVAPASDFLDRWSPALHTRFVTDQLNYDVPFAVEHLPGIEQPQRIADGQSVVWRLPASYFLHIPDNIVCKACTLLVDAGRVKAIAERGRLQWIAGQAPRLIVDPAKPRESDGAAKPAKPQQSDGDEKKRDWDGALKAVERRANKGRIARSRARTIMRDYWTKRGLPQPAEGKSGDNQIYKKLREKAPKDWFVD